MGIENNNGGLGQNRTADTWFFRPLLYRLSYKTVAVPTGIKPATPPWQGGMLSLHQGTMVAGAGFEPTTFRLWAWRATELLYPAMCYTLLSYNNNV